VNRSLKYSPPAFALEDRSFSNITTCRRRKFPDIGELLAGQTDQAPFGSLPRAKVCDPLPGSTDGNKEVS
jgi:hypothetical protein